MKTNVEQNYQIVLVVSPNKCNGCYYLKKILQKDFRELGGRTVDIIECYYNSILDLRVGDICPNCLKGKLMDN